MNKSKIKRAKIVARKTTKLYSAKKAALVKHVKFQHRDDVAVGNENYYLASMFPNDDVMREVYSIIHSNRKM